MTILFETLSGLFGAYTAYLYLSGFYSEYRSNNNSVKLKCIIFAVMFVLVNWTPTSGLVRTGLIATVIIAFSAITFLARLSRIFITTVVFLVLTVAAEILCELPLFFLGITRADMLANGVIRCLLIPLSAFINLLIVSTVVKIFGRKGLFDMPTYEFGLLAICQIICILICVVMLDVAGYASQTTLTLIVAAVVGLVFINIMFLLYMRYIRISNQNEKDKCLAQQQLNLQIAYYQSLLKAREETRSMWHDMKKQIYAVATLMRENKNEDAETCLEEIEQRFNKISNVVDVDHPVINALLNHALAKAQERGITINMDVFVAPDLNISPLDLSVVLGNTLDNAIEACVNIHDISVPRRISLILRQKQQMLYYCISNPCETAVPKQEREGVHGYGLKNVQACVQKNSGSMQITHEKNFYIVEVILNAQL